MRHYSPGASIHSDYYHSCDCCEVDDGRPVIFWEKQNFALCLECLESLARLHVGGAMFQEERIVVNRASIPESLRNAIFDRDENKCKLCGSGVNLRIDHIIPFSRGGRTEKSNLQTLCLTCNLKKRAHAE